VVAWDVAKLEEAQIAADLMGRAYLRDRLSKGRHHRKPAGGTGSAEILL